MSSTNKKGDVWSRTPAPARPPRPAATPTPTSSDKLAPQR